ncbi:MAG TPA: hypothetical protein VFE60_12570 [Roseiarcus sp.]|nr:hypothetical protein [Roseiarcus sp.]
MAAIFLKRVRELGHFWSVDKVLVDANRRAAALEWTQFAKSGRVLRGVDWFVFEAGSFRIQGFARTALRQSNPTSSARSCGISITPDAAIR